MKYLALFFVLPLILIGCTKPNRQKPFSNPTESIEIRSEETSTTSNRILKEKNTIEITQNGFLPNNYSIRLGTTIKWINKDSNPHLIRFTDKKESPVLKKNDEYSRTFEQAGEYYFDCAIHTYLKGKIIVEE